MARQHFALPRMVHTQLGSQFRCSLVADQGLAQLAGGAVGIAQQQVGFGTVGRLGNGLLAGRDGGGPVLATKGRAALVEHIFQTGGGLGCFALEPMSAARPGGAVRNRLQASGDDLQRLLALPGIGERIRQEGIGQPVVRRLLDCCLEIAAGLLRCAGAHLVRAQPHLARGSRRRFRRPGPSAGRPALRMDRVD